MLSQNSDMSRQGILTTQTQLAFELEDTQPTATKVPFASGNSLRQPYLTGIGHDVMRHMRHWLGIDTDRL